MSGRKGHFRLISQPTKAAKPIKRRDVVMPCPVDGCDDQAISWTCLDCGHLLECGLQDGLLYCECGVTECTNLKFMCGGHIPKEASPKKLESALDKLKPYEEVNLLILGETGVGKSTFINAFANYLSYNTLDEAREGKLITLIPNEFFVTDADHNSVCIANGVPSDEENASVGQSATQAAKVHRFIFGETVLRIIDTPGIGDVRGTLKDDENFKNILDTVASLDRLHGIIILLKPNQARLTITFRYCMEELLVHLHKSAVANMIFGFTNTRGTNFMPGDTLPPLKKLLAEKAVGLDSRKDNTFCFDSEGYRFLAALGSGVKYDADCVSSYRSSWKCSVRETERLIKYVKSLSPHDTKQTLSLNNARILILQLTKPMAEITRAIIITVEGLECAKKVVSNLDESNADLMESLIVEKIDFVSSALSYPRTVCTNSACVKVSVIDGIKKTNYITWCHDHCYLKGVTVETTNNPALIHCWAMGGTHNCRGCGHNYGEHMHITYELIENKVQVENEAIKQLIDQNASASQLKAAKISELQGLVKEFREEHLAIEKIAAKFGAFLKHNAITAYSDARLEYLQFLISEEEKKPSELRDTQLVQALVEAKQIYQEQVAIIDKAIKEGQAELDEVKDPATIGRLIDDLFSLKHYGKSVEEIQKVAIQHSAKFYNETSHRQTGSSLGLFRSWFRKGSDVSMRFSGQEESKKKESVQAHRADNSRGSYNGRGRSRRVECFNYGNAGRRNYEGPSTFGYYNGPQHHQRPWCCHCQRFGHVSMCCPKFSGRRFD